MNMLEHISAVSALVHEGLESWARTLLRDAGIETTEVYGSFPPEGSVASHIVLFPYRVGPAENQLSAPDQVESLMGSRAKNLSRKGGIPDMWLDIGEAMGTCIMEHFPRAGDRSPLKERPHPMPPVDLLPEPLKAWYSDQPDTGEENSWVTDYQGRRHARLPSLVWQPPVTLRMQYLVVIGEGARGTADRAVSTAPIAVQTLSVLAAGMQMRRQISIRVPPAPYDREIIPYAKAIAQVMGGEIAERLKESVGQLGRKADVAVTLIPGANLTNADFTGLMQALQRPLQPTLHLGVQVALGGSPVFAPGINAEVRADRMR